LTLEDARDVFPFIEIAIAAFRGESDKLTADTRQQVEELRATELR
jgi:hypothetical protein